MSIEIWDWGLGYIYLWDVLIAWWGGWPTPWTPWANTIAYWKYENNLNDSSWNNHTLSNYNSISYSTNPYAVNLSTSNYLYFNNTDLNHDWTFNTWVYLTNRNVSTAWTAIVSQWSGGTYRVLFITMNYYWVLWAWVFWSDLVGNIQTPLNQWVNICVTFNYSTKNLKSFINWVKDIDGTLTSSYSVPSWNFIMWWLADNPSDRNWKIQWSLSNTILESSEWNEALPQTYYNQTKSNYWL